MYNKLYDLRLDWTFKNVFLDKSSFNYICYLFSILLNLNYSELKCYMKIINSELPSGVLGIKSSYSDIIFEYKELNIILEMNLEDIEYHINKNYFYLFKQHSSRLNNKNRYKNKKTILINLDTYDVLKKQKLIYKSNLMFSSYNICLYKNIEIIHVNLDYLKKKYYNKNVLNELEKLLIIFIEQDVKKIKKITKRREVLNIMDYMARLNFKEGYPVTYDREEAEKVKLEMRAEEDRRRKLEDKKRAMEDKKRAMEDKKRAMEDKKRIIEDKKRILKDQELIKREEKLRTKELNLAKSLKDEGIPIEKIIKLTNLNRDQIMML